VSIPDITRNFVSGNTKKKDIPDEQTDEIGFRSKKTLNSQKIHLYILNEKYDIIRRR